MDPVTASLVAAGIQVGGEVFGGFLESNSAKSANKMAAAEAQKQRDWQQRMSNTAHQREVDDLRAAGLNPILSSHGGASTPGGAMAPVLNTGVGAARGISSASRVAGDRMLTKSTIDAQKAQTAASAASAAQAVSQAELINAQTKIVNANVPKAQQRGDVHKGTYGKILAYTEETLGAIGTPLVAGFAGGALSGSARSLARRTSSGPSIKRSSYEAYDSDAWDTHYRHGDAYNN